MRNIVRKGSFILLITTFVSLIAQFQIFKPIKVSANTSEINLGTISDYNGVIFGNHTATGADTEGALAVEKNSDISTWGFSYGANFEHYNNIHVGDPIRDNFDIALLIGEKIIGDNGKGVIRGDGKAVISKSYEEENRQAISISDEVNNIITLDEKEIENQFNKFRSETKNLENCLDGFKPGDKDKIIVSDESGPIMELSGASTNKEILVSENDLSSFNTLFFEDLSKYSNVIIKSTAEEITFSNGSIFYNGNQVAIIPNNDILKELSSKIIWYFPNATHITVDGGYAVIGSVIAPNATMDGNSGNVNGQAILKNLNQKNGFELHNFYYNKPQNNLSGFQLKKIDSETKEQLSGAEFKLVDSNGQIIKSNLVTNEKGIIEVTDLAPGEYELIETKAPEGYELDSTPIKFVINPEDSKIVNLVKENRKKDSEILKGAVELKKVDSETKEQLSGAEFKLVDSNGQIIESNLITNEKGIIEINDLAPGEYELIETKAPEGYELDSTPIKFVINLEDSKIVNLVKENRKKDSEILKGAVELKKVDSETKEQLSGAEFKLINSKGQLLEKKLVTNEKGIIEVKDLAPGEYELIETKAPEGYELDSTPVKFTIKSDEVKKVTLAKENTKKDKVVMRNSVILNKVDGDTKEALPGVKFNLVDSKGNIIHEGLYTDENGVLEIDNLEPGKYEFIEIKALEGYELDSNPLEFIIENNKNIELEKINRKEVITNSDTPRTLDNNNPLVYIIFLCSAIAVVKLVMGKSKE